MNYRLNIQVNILQNGTIAVDIRTIRADKHKAHIYMEMLDNTIVGCKERHLNVKLSIYNSLIYSNLPPFLVNTSVFVKHKKHKYIK